jgi:outer membrane protein OmpA-like peptidoglycan-associated protein
MRKSLFILILVSIVQLTYANSYRVEVAVFDKKVPMDYFYNLTDVKLAVDVNRLYRYYLGDFSDAAKANNLKNEVIAKGYKYAKVIDLAKAREECAMMCKAPLYVQNIFFDFDRSNLRSQSRRDLSDLATLMKDNPTYKVELSAHTDSKGSLEYNTALSQRRSKSAKDYLISLGINAGRIATSEFGETSPIAKNDFGGKDSPDGRQFNRRVVITVMDAAGKIISNVVKAIDVPASLQN